MSFSHNDNLRDFWSENTISWGKTGNLAKYIVFTQMAFNPTDVILRCILDLSPPKLAFCASQRLNL